MNNNIKIIVDSISGSTDRGYSKVFLNNATFLNLIGSRPLISPTETEVSPDSIIKTFVIDGVTIYSRYEKPVAPQTKGKTSFVMKTEDAEKCLAAKVALPFNVAIFASSIVASA